MADGNKNGGSGNNVLVINAAGAETRVALVENGTIHEYYLERKREKGIVGNIYKGRVVRVLPGMQAAFVDIGLEKAAFLYVGDVYGDPDFSEEFELTEGEHAAEVSEVPDEQEAEAEEARAQAAAAAPPPAEAQAAAEGQPVEATPGIAGPGLDAAVAEVPADLAPADAAPEAPHAEELSPSDVHLIEEPTAGEVPPPLPLTPVPLGTEFAGMPASPSAPALLVPAEPAAEAPAIVALPSPETVTPLPPAPEGTVAPLVEIQPGTPAEAAPPVGIAPVEGEAPAADRIQAREREAAREARGDKEPREGRDRDRGRREERGRRDGRDRDREGGREGREGREGGRDRGGRNGHGHGHREEKRKEPKNIQDLLKEGQEVIVQVAKDPIGTKGARITSHISLPGRHLVFMPTVDHIGISRRIEKDGERRRLREIVDRMRPEGTGFIVRTVAESVEAPKLEADIRFLITVWNEIIRQKDKVSAPALLHPDLDLILRATRDLFTSEVGKLVIDDRDEHERICRFVREQSPHLESQIELYRGEEPIFDAYGIEQELKRAAQRKVWLKSGGYIIIDQAEALTAIDVNSGRYVGKKNLEETITKINVEAAKEIVYQLRLRNIGGIVILDFIDMDKPQNRDKVFKALQEALGRDKAKTNVLKISDLGLVEMTRKRVRESVTRMTSEPCAYCEGKGHLKSKVTVAYEIFREIRREAAHFSEPVMVVNCHPEVARMLQGEEREELRYLMDRFNKTIQVRAQSGYHQEQFDLYGRQDRGEAQPGDRNEPRADRPPRSDSGDRDGGRNEGGGREGRDRGGRGGRDRDRNRGRDRGGRGGGGGGDRGNRGERGDRGGGGGGGDRGGERGQQGGGQRDSGPREQGQQGGQRDAGQQPAAAPAGEAPKTEG
ncbi:MAG: Rne/Rng family ribonuclease [Anaeromyxobacter sp.]